MISKRIECLVKSLEKCNVLADIGCDHGYVAVEAIKRRIAKKVIAVDLNPKPLKKAIALAKKENVDDKIRFVIGNGFENIDENVDEAVVAGMGSESICSILKSANDKILKTTLLLQPMKDVEFLRKWLFDNSFDIIDEIILKEKNKFYIIIKSKKSENIIFDPIDVYVGRHHKDKNPVSFEFLRNQKEKFLKIIEQKESSNKDIEYEKLRLHLIEEVLSSW